MFFTVTLSRDESVLTYKMNPVIRFVFIFFLVSLAGMFLFDFSLSDFREASILGKINIFLLPLLVCGGSLYRYTIMMDKTKESITMYRGFGVFISRKIVPLSSLTAVVKQRVHSGIQKDGASGFLARERFIIGFIIDGRFIILSRTAKRKQADQLFGAFRAFFPLPYEIT